MTTDKELLQLAAKAAGIEIYTQVGNTILYKIGKYLGHWNPLTSNDDALRLAVKLRMEIDIAENWVAVRHYAGIKTLAERTTMPTPEPAPVPPQIDIARMALHAKFRVYDTIDEAADYHRNAYRRNNRIRWALVMGAPISPIDQDGTHKDLGGMETVPTEALINFRKATA